LVVHRHTKTGRNRRIPLVPELFAELRGRVGRLVPFGERSSGDFARVVRQRADVDSFKVKDLRSTFACLWVERGGSLQALKKLLGHSTIVTTQRYADLGEDMLRREVARVSNVGLQR
jgi:integrase